MLDGVVQHVAILENTLQAMCALGAQRHTLCSVIGPTIQVCSYPVGPEFLSSIQECPLFPLYPFLHKEGFFNLPGYVRHRLRQSH